MRYRGQNEGNIPKLSPFLSSLNELREKKKESSWRIKKDLIDQVEKANSRVQRSSLESPRRMSFESNESHLLEVKNEFAQNDQNVNMVDDALCGTATRAEK